MPHVLSGELRALAVTTAEPSLVAPGLPTVAALGLPGYDTGTLYGVFAPARTPVTIITRLNFVIVRFLRTASARERFLKSGVEVKGSTPDEFAKKIQVEIVRMKKLIMDAGIRGE